MPNEKRAELEYGTSLSLQFPRTHESLMKPDLVLGAAGLRRATCIVRMSQRCLYGHVARRPTEDPARRILYCRDTRGWTTPSSRLHPSWLRQLKAYLWNMGMVGLTPAWAMARRRNIVSSWMRRRVAPPYRHTSPYEALIYCLLYFAFRQTLKI